MSSGASVSGCVTRTVCACLELSIHRATLPKIIYNLLFDLQLQKSQRLIQKVVQQCCSMGGQLTRDLVCNKSGLGISVYVCVYLSFFIFI